MTYSVRPVDETLTDILVPTPNGLLPAYFWSEEIEEIIDDDECTSYVLVLTSPEDDRIFIRLSEGGISIALQRDLFNEDFVKELVGKYSNTIDAEVESYDDTIWLDISLDFECMIFSFELIF